MSFGARSGFLGAQTMDDVATKPGTGVAPTPADPTLERTFRGHRDTVTSLSFSNSMRQLVSASTDGCLMLWSFRPQLRAFRFVGHKVRAAASALALAPRPLTSASAGRRQPRRVRAQRRAHRVRLG